MNPAPPVTNANSFWLMIDQRSSGEFDSRSSRKSAQGFHVVAAAVGHPAVELGRVLELLASWPADREEGARQVGQGRQVAPELLELGDGEDVLLAMSPPPLDVLDRHVGRHPRREGAD